MAAQRIRQHKKIVLNAELSEEIGIIHIIGCRGWEKKGRTGGRRLKVTYPHPRRHWTWWQRTSPTPCGCQPDSDHRPRGTWAAGWTGRWSTTARTTPSSCRSDRTSGWQSSPPAQCQERVGKNISRLLYTMLRSWTAYCVKSSKINFSNNKMDRADRPVNKRNQGHKADIQTQLIHWINSPPLHTNCAISFWRQQ